MDPIEEIKDLIRQLVEENDGNKVSIASKIKNKYKTYRKETRKKGKLNEQITKEIVSYLLKNYESIKEYEPINETFNLLIEDYNTLSEESNELKKQEYNKRIFEIHTNILGYPGTDVKGMPLEYLKIIIESKLDLENGANRDDIINILSQVSRCAEYDIEKYNKFFDDILIPIVDLDIKNSTTDLKNPKIIEILTEIAKNYKRNGEYDKCKEICEKGLKLKQFKETEQYSELQRESNKIDKAVKVLDTNFEKLVDISEINSAEELIEIIRKYILEGEQEEIVTDNKVIPRPDPDPDPVPVPNPHHEADKMTLEEKCIALFGFLTELRKENPNVKFTTPSKGKKGTTWDKYILLPVSSADFTILESFVDEENHRLYMVKNENIEKIDKCSKKSEVINEPGVTCVNHSKHNSKRYEERLMEKYRELMGLEPIEKKTKRVYKKRLKVSDNKVEEKSEIANNEQNSEAEVTYDISNDTVAENTVSEDVEAKSEELDLENLSEEDLLTMTASLNADLEKIDEDNKKLQEEAERLKEEAEKLKQERRRKLIEELQKKRKEMQEKEAQKRELKQVVERLKEEQKNIPGQTNDSGDTQADDQ